MDEKSCKRIKIVLQNSQTNIGKESIKFDAMSFCQRYLLAVVVVDIGGKNAFEVQEYVDDLALLVKNTFLKTQ